MTTVQVSPGEGGHSRMIDGELVARAVAQDSAGSFEVVITVPVDPPVEDSLAAILSVTQRHGVSLVGA